MLKLRLLQFLMDKDGQAGLNAIRNTFTLFGYEANDIKMALNSLVRLECQLCRSDGLDVFNETWGDEHETI